MQTFLPFDKFMDSASVLDNRRLGKQRVEAYQILRALQGETRGWVNHPATRMWRGYEHALGRYGYLMCQEWKARGFKDTLMPHFIPLTIAACEMPPWLGDENFHLSHQSNLVRKFPQHYGCIFPGVPDDMKYVWPV